MDVAPDVDSISIEGRFVLMTDGEVIPITDFLDDDGDECEPGEAVSIVAGRDGYGWFEIELNDERETMH